MHQRLSLATHVRACQCGEQVILLDLHRNKYIRVAGSNLPSLAASIEGWPPCPWSGRKARSQPDLDALTRPLLARGLLTRSASEGTVAVALVEADRSLNAEDDSHDSSPMPRQVWHFARSAVVTSYRLHHQSLYVIAERIRAARLRSGQECGRDGIEALSSSVSIFYKLRPFVFTARDNCLLDSLVMIHFLAANRHFPRLVLGVRPAPFRAHSWVQSGSVVLNDQHEHVLGFCPILVV